MSMRKKVCTLPFWEEDVVALFELKFTSETAQSTADWVKDDLKKLKD